MTLRILCYKCDGLSVHFDRKIIKSNSAAPFLRKESHFKSDCTNVGTRRRRDNLFGGAPVSKHRSQTTSGVVDGIL